MSATGVQASTAEAAVASPTTGMDVEAPAPGSRGHAATAAQICAAVVINPAAVIAVGLVQGEEFVGLVQPERKLISSTQRGARGIFVHSTKN